MRFLLLRAGVLMPPRARLLLLARSPPGLDEAPPGEPDEAPPGLSYDWLEPPDICKRAMGCRVRRLSGAGIALFLRVASHVVPPRKNFGAES